MICITTQGTAHERGYQHGSQAAELIREVHGRYIAKGVLDANPTPLLRQLETRFPELISEMEGIAAGSGVAKDQVFRMNLMPLGAGPACSVVGVRDSDGNAWIAKTDDIAEDELGSNILRRDVPVSGAVSLHLHFAGTIWTSTVFAANGFCMAMTGMASGPGPQDGLPPQVLWRVLSDRCATAREAVEFLQSFELNSGGMSLLLADSGQRLLLVEKTAQGQCVREWSASDGLLCHTNHAWVGNLKDPPGFRDTPLGLNSRDRLNKLHGLVSALSASSDGLRSLCTDHTPPGAICQHGGGGLHTDYAVILSPSAGGIWLSMGPPCKAPFEFISIK